MFVNIDVGRNFDKKILTEMTINNYYGILGNINIFNFLSSQYDIRKQLLIFDKLVINPISDINELIKPQEDIPEWITNIFKSLKEATDEGYIEQKDYLVNEEESNSKDYFQNVTDNLIYQIQADSDLRKIHEKLFVTQNICKQGKDLGFSENARLKFALAQEEYWTRFKSYYISKEKNVNTIPLIRGNDTKDIEELFNENSLNELTTKQKCISIIINNLPVLDDKIPIKEVIAYKNDESKQLDYFKLMNWVNMISKNNFSENEFKEHLCFKLKDYEDNLKLHKLKYRYSTWETKLVTSSEILENFLKLNLSKVVKSFFEINKSSIQSIMEEKNLPNSEIAYIIKSDMLNR